MHHTGLRLDRVKVLNHRDEDVELSQGTLRESLHLAVLQDIKTLKTLDDELCNQKSPRVFLTTNRDECTTT